MSASFLLASASCLLSNFSAKKKHNKGLSFSAFSTLSSVRAFAELRRRREITTPTKRREAFHFCCFSGVVFGGVSLESIYNINGEKLEPIWSVVRIQNHVVIVIFLLRGTSGGGKFESATDQQRNDENNDENNANRFRGGGKDDGDDGNRSNDHQNTPLRSIIQRRAKALTEATAGGFYLHRIYRGPNRE